MADLPVALPGSLAARLARSLDPEGKIPRALDALGQLSGRDVVLLDGDGGIRARQLIELGARLTVAVRPAAPDGARAELAGLEPPVRLVEGTALDLDLPADSADALVSCWSSFRGPSQAEVLEADRVLRPGGRLLVLHDYGRDDVSNLWPEAQAEHFAWSRRDGWFLRSGFRIRVIHCWWTFESIDEARELLVDLGGERGAAVADGLKRARLSYNVAVYHRTRGENGPDREPEAAGRSTRDA